MKNVSLNEVVTKRENNLNMIKIMAAIMVIVGHSYAFAGGYEKYDWLYVLTDGHGDLGAFAVYIFFFYSGLLITQSIMRNSNTMFFWKRRIKRIYPAFALVTLSIVLVAAPFFTTLNPVEYYTNGETYQYLWNLVFLTQHNLPGVFVGNVYGTSVNGPIWTIRVEVFCYLLCFVYAKLGLLHKKRTGISVILYFMVIAGFGYAAFRGVEGSLAVLMPITMFFVGMLYSVYGENIRLSKAGMWFSLVGFIGGILLHQVILACVVFLPYILCCVAFGIKNYGKYVKGFDRLGQCSYEIYLWGGFVGQAVTYMCGGYMSEYLNMLITIPVSIILGYATHKILE